MENMLFASVARDAATAKANARSPFTIRGISMKPFLLSIFALMAAGVPSSAITVTTPSSGAQLSSPFTLTASATTCASKTAESMGYSIDHGQAIIEPTSFTTLVVAGEGSHVLHVKCWGQKVNDEVLIDITVVPPDTLNPPTNATVVSNIQSLPTWEWEHDPGTPGNSTGTSEITSTPSMTGNSRQFSVNFSNSGGEIYHDAFGTDTQATHFIYDAYVMLTQSSSLANIEMDMNQVMPNGLTVIYGFQCSSYSGKWEYSYNIGTPQNPIVKWFASNATCPRPSTWSTNVWHHVQIFYFRDSLGNVTYQSASMDGDQQELIGATGSSTFDLHWKPVLATNFQLDGEGSDGSITAYVDKITVSRW
jgi:hypothetical protein